MLTPPDHSDPSGLYSYKNQPSRVLFALDSLASALLPILGYEAKNGALPSEGWSAGVTADDVRAWDAAGLEAIDGWNKVWDAEFEAAEAAAWAKVRSKSIEFYSKVLSADAQRFGLRTQQQTDARRVVRDHLSLLQAHSADFSTSLRLLSFFDPARVAEDSYLSAFTARWVAAACGDLPSDSATRAREDITAWLRTYAARIDADELAAWCDQDRLKAMRAVNPRFVLRQWVLEDTIKQMDEALDKDDVAAARKVLARALDVS